MNTVKKSTRPNNLLSIKESQARRERPLTGIGIWRLGFRPFYLGAALFSAIAISLWLATIFGYGSPPSLAKIHPVYWHAHEMVFGFALAVIAGFLLTASNNWTGILPAAGLPLVILFLLWGFARYCMIEGDIMLAAWSDVAFATLLVVLLFRVLFLAKLWKNFTILGLVLLMGGLNAWFYTMTILELPADALYPVELALLVILQLLVIMGGRVIPMFTQNGVPGIVVWKPAPLATLTPTLSALGILAWLILPPAMAVLGCAAAAGINLVRWAGWKPWRCLHHPMVWVLQLGYLWIPITFIFMALVSLGIAPRSLPVHALAVGAMGLIIAGMITRTAMGHTGRQIIATPLETSVFLLIAVSGLCRVLVAVPGLQSAELTPNLLLISGIAWITAFLLYLYRYTPWLFRPRLDGRPG